VAIAQHAKTKGIRSVWMWHNASTQSRKQQKLVNNDFKLIIAQWFQEIISIFFKENSMVYFNMFVSKQVYGLDKYK
jgi:hypothetical protein